MTMGEATLGAALAGAAGALAAISVLWMLPAAAALPGPLRRPAARIGHEARLTARTLRDAGAIAPVTPDAARRLRVAGAAAAAFPGWVLGGGAGALLCCVAGAWSAPRLARARRARHGRRLDAGAPALARAIADALAGGASIRHAPAAAARALPDPVAQEVGRTAWELEMGAGTDAALERLRTRSSSGGIALVVAAMQVQRRSGGDLPRVLRDVAAALEEERRVLDEARAATAQARFTAWVVIVLPLCGIAMGALAAPGLVARMTGSALGAGLLLAALALQAAGVLAIRRLARSFA